MNDDDFEGDGAYAEDFWINTGDWVVIALQRELDVF